MGEENMWGNKYGENKKKANNKIRWNNIEAEDM